ncbi:MAG TPA: hypoxanthine phosphoribosyltransferase [Gemmataceae bacterium]|nr:hypoxanthine phosphoribosyltransferase [Gemmataceae bacterium]
MTGETLRQPEIRVLLSEQQIRDRVAQLAEQISRDYAGKQPLIVGVLKGAWVFMADLVRRLTVPTRCDFIKLSSYGEETATTGRVQLHLDLNTPAEGLDILVVEDIVDTGTCVRWLLDHLRRKGPASIRLCALLDNPARRIAPITIDYVGFTIPDCFVVGYGIDWKERFRELPHIGRLT